MGVLPERLRDSEACLKALRDAPELEKIREAQESRNRHEQSKLKVRKIEEGVTTCQLSGEPLEANSEAHHIERKADNPKKALDLDNVVLVNPAVHQEIHRKGAESPEELKALCEEKNWKAPFK